MTLEEIQAERETRAKRLNAAIVALTDVMDECLPASLEAMNAGIKLGELSYWGDLALDAWSDRQIEQIKS